MRRHGAVEHGDGEHDLGEGEVVAHQVGGVRPVERGREQRSRLLEHRAERLVGARGGADGGGEPRRVELEGEDLGEEVLEEVVAGVVGGVLLEGVHAHLEDGGDEGPAVGEVAVEGSASDVGASGDEVERRGGAFLAEDLGGGGDEPGPVALGVAPLGHPTSVAERGRRPSVPGGPRTSPVP